MGTYVNPGHLAFTRIAGPNYVDKTALIKLMNDRVDGADSLVCVSRPRRFGKSYAVNMTSMDQIHRIRDLYFGQDTPTAHEYSIKNRVCQNRSK